MHLRSLIITLLISASAFAQNEAVVQEGEIGISAGAAHYFGDLNNLSAINRPGPSFGIYFRKQFGNYVALRFAGHYAEVGYADNLSSVEVQRRRNLDFKSTIWEISAQGDFNFFEFIPGSPYYFFTPYITFGVGTFGFDPYTFLNNQKYYLRKLGTEGQGSPLYPDKKFYRTQAFSFPLGMGIKYNIWHNVNLGFEITHRYTTTDYLDDVSGTYAGTAAFPQKTPGVNTPAYYLQDRSYETGTPIGIAGKQRGFSEQKDQYIFAEMTISISFSSYKCANPK